MKLLKKLVTGESMRALVSCIAAALSMMPMLASAQTSENSLAAVYREAFRKAKTDQEITSVTHACRLEATSIHADEMHRLLNRAEKLVDSKVNEWPALMAKVQALMED